MRRIYKYELKLDGKVSIPVGAGIISVGAQGDNMYLWAKVDPDQSKMETRIFHAYATGQDISDDESIVFIGTVMMYNGALVWHVFEVA